MSPDKLKALLTELADGGIDVEEAVERLRHLPFRDLGFARIDGHRELRNGLAEVVYGEGKTAEQIVAIARAMIEAGQNVLVTRIDEHAASHLCSELPDFHYDPMARIAWDGVKSRLATPAGVSVAVVSAGTADQAVAREAELTLEFLGVRVSSYRDVGVSGIHRLLAEREAIGNASVVIVVAGMEGALPSVVGGLVDIPVIAVPTSVGYGASFGGLAALLAMLNSCAAGVTVVNIDNGFGAAVAALQIVRTATRSNSR